MTSARFGVSTQTPGTIATPSSGHAMAAASAGFESIVRQLLDADTANTTLNQKDVEGYTPLMYAVKNGQEFIIRMLINARANVGVEAPDGASARSMTLNAEAKGHSWAQTVKMLLDAAGAA